MNRAGTLTIEQLLGELDSHDAKDVVEAINELGARNAIAASSRLLGILRETNEPSIRNAAALALSDMQDPDAFAEIVELLKSNRTEGSRGTLLYALYPYDCTPILPLLVDFVIDGGLEVSLEAFNRTSGIETVLDGATWQESVQRLRSALADATDEKRPILEALLDRFDQHP